ncbi:DNA methylase [Sphaerisporangium siamense]|uniref:site-specific DNA-methyltransferase (adenine-specific) n=1 Tax=Sphaerisporangium siamense TaxID=795645 RepID=A0A7W7GE66_9ACTN|nr:BREX-2 system adenine-specific DNA-methyltransferase PglX [Sphaerisporangium siamense]MBB4705174.1 hypothetical protein [Sphaerisporangium siamense]GII83982.1 DNA methylase [Sphaerisporangium siamense]
MSVVSAEMLKDLQRQARLLEADLRAQAEEREEIGERLREMHAKATSIGRTAETWNSWLTAQAAQAASSWVLACVFVRFCEDNDLTAHRWIASADYDSDASTTDNATGRHTIDNGTDWHTTNNEAGGPATDHRVSGPATDNGIGGATNNGMGGPTTDNEVGGPTIDTASGRATTAAADAEEAWIAANPRLSSREWLREAFRWLRSTRAGHGLFPDTDFVWWWDISADAADALIANFRRRDPSGIGLALPFHSPTLDTRFLGDLYQDLSEDIRKRYALLQTPEFVEEFILDLTLTPALDDFGLEGFKLIDPTCGSGHFLLGAFGRLLDAWTEHAPGLDPRVRVQKVLDSIHGVDINPAATAITKFRLTAAALKACEITSLDVPEAPALQLRIGTGDSLIYGGDGGRQLTLDDADPLSDHQYAWEDLHHYLGILHYNQYQVVVGNPPYITVKDKALNIVYRDRYAYCAGKYALSVPFAELFFRLAIQDDRRPGYVGQITSNSFMKREFGRKLIEEFLRNKVDLTHVVDTSGAFIPGHGTPTVILAGKNRDRNRLSTVRGVLGVRGEPSQPTEPAKGLVWRSIVENTGNLGDPPVETEFVSIRDLQRTQLESYPWSLSGGGASALMTQVNTRESTLLGDTAQATGFVAITAEDDAFFAPQDLAGRHREVGQLRPMVEGDQVRNYAIELSTWTIWPYDDCLNPKDIAQNAGLEKWFWPNRRILQRRKRFGRPVEEIHTLRWYEFGELYREKLTTPLSLTFAFVATHNQFALDRGGKVFKQSAPVIKLPDRATEDDYLRLLGVLNSSTACFWLKQVCHDKGSQGVNEGFKSQAWERFYEFTGTKLQDFPLPTNASSTRARLLDSLAQALALVASYDISTRMAPTLVWLTEAHRRYIDIRAQMISIQEELDWEIYQLYAILNEELTYNGDDLPKLNLGERAFEIALARKMAAEEVETQWFKRHGSVPITELPAHWPQVYKDIVNRRIEMIGSHPLLHLIERAECKRRWAAEPYEKKQAEALRSWMLDRLEGEHLWIDGEDPRTVSVAQLADLVRTDADFRQVMELYLNRPDYDMTAELGKLLKDEHVPYLAAYRYKDSGLLKRKDWEGVWDLQRREDAGEKVTINVPPKYASADFKNASYWKHRGKLDVPKERFIGYPNAERDGDPTPVYGWAGWDHLAQARALADLLVDRAYETDRATPLLAGIAELEPWLHQWHGEYDAKYSGSPAAYLTDFLNTELQRHGVTREQLKAWRPPAAGRGRKKGA